MYRFQFGKIAAIALLLAPLAATAHHAVAMYDTADPFNLAGTVKSFEMGNPHSWLTLTVPDQGGGTTDWLVECNSVALLKRFGWTRTSVKPGDRISLSIAPHFDGIRRGEAILVTTVTGAKLSNAMVEP
jgi:hypothetical protein